MVSGWVNSCFSVFCVACCVFMEGGGANGALWTQAKRSQQDFLKNVKRIVFQVLSFTALFVFKQSENMRLRKSKNVWTTAQQITLNCSAWENARTEQLTFQKCQSFHCFPSFYIPVSHPLLSAANAVVSAVRWWFLTSWQIWNNGSHHQPLVRHARDFSRYIIGWFVVLRVNWLEQMFWQISEFKQTFDVLPSLSLPAF